MSNLYLITRDEEYEYFEGIVTIDKPIPSRDPAEVALFISLGSAKEWYHYGTDYDTKDWEDYMAIKLEVYKCI